MNAVIVMRFSYRPCHYRDTTVFVLVLLYQIFTTFFHGLKVTIE